MGSIPRSTYAVYGVVLLATALGNMAQTALNVMLLDIVSEFGVTVATRKVVVG